jgi:hypothetical protein
MSNNTQEYINYYIGLLPMEYQLPNAQGTIGALAELALMPQGHNVVTDSDDDIVFSGDDVVYDSDYGEIMPLAIPQAFVLANAEGQQLQFLGKIVGAQNFGLNLSGQFITLTDAQYRLLIYAVAARNQLRATNGNIDVFLNQYFSGILTVTDQLGMAMTFNYLPEFGTVPWAELFITQGYLPRPLGVQANIVYTYPVTGPFFALIGEDQAALQPNAVGLDSETGSLTGYVMAENWTIPFPY